MSDTEKPSWEWQQEIQATVLLYQSQIASLRQQLAEVTQERDDYKKRAEWKHVHDDSLELELQKQLATTTAHLEAQRTATYQAVEREHEAKKQLATVTAERDEAVRIARELVGLAPITDADIQWAEALLAAKQRQKGQP